MEYNQYGQIFPNNMYQTYSPYRQFDFLNRSFEDPTIWAQNARNDRDMDYLKNMFPNGMRGLQRVVEEESDRMDYEGSPIYEEYPDPVFLRGMANRIRERVENDDMLAEYSQMLSREEFTEEGIQSTQWRNKNNFVDDLVTVLLFNEIFNRRCRHRNCRRFW